jgi:Exopolysaccharide biosynthesis protein YbjH
MILRQMCKENAEIRRKKRFFSSLTCLLAIACFFPAPVMQAQDASYMSTFGTPGLLDMPSALQLPDGNLAFTIARAGSTQRNTLTFQISPRLSGSFRYAIIRDFDPGLDRFDRSFDLTYLLRQESDWGPGVAVGLRDFAGTGIYSSEFLAATKSFGPQFRATIGLGWGRLAQRDGFDNPLASLANYFETRPRAAAGGISTTGQLDFGSWFRGDTAVFGGLEWMPNDRTRIVLEYSTDAYRIETKHGVIEQQSPLNIGVNYRFRNGVDLGLSYMYGTDVGVSLTYVLDPENPPSAGGIESAPSALLPRDRTAALSWHLVGNQPQGPALDVLSAGLAEQGLILDGIEQSGSLVTVYLGNPTYAAGAQAVGRAARILANSAPADVTAFRIVPVAGGIPLSQVTVQRSDLEELEHALDGSWQSYTRAQIEDAAGLNGPFGAPLNSPAFSFDISPYLSPSLFDPDNPFRADAGLQASASYAVTPQFVLSGAIRQPVLGNLDTASRISDSILPHVRSDFALYDKASDLELSYLTSPRAIWSRCLPGSRPSYCGSR